MAASSASAANAAAAVAGGGAHDRRIEPRRQRPVMSGKRVLAGFHAVTARLRHAPESIEALYVDGGRHDGRMQQLLARAEGAGVRVTVADAARLQRLAGGSNHQGVVAVCGEAVLARSLDDVLATVNAETLLLLLDGVTDPRNLGACMRTAEAAGAQAVIVPRDRSASLTAVVAAAAAGAAETLPLIAVTNLARAMEEIREAGVWIAGAAGEADKTLYEIDLTGPLAWALGAEGEGLRRLTREKCDWLARIPLHGQVESLNVSVATGICLFETRRQRASSATGGRR
jgi:23S rRNA (guanosine2251-2'-O)-methyltransferase